MERSQLPSGALLDVPSDPRQIMSRLVEEALAEVDADRCTLTSIDQSVMRVEASHQRNGRVPSFVNAEYPLDSVQQQPMLREAVTTGRIATGPGFAQSTLVDSKAAAEIGLMHRVAVVPLLEGGVTQALLILSRASERDFKRAELRSLQRFGTMALLALRIARMLEHVEATQRRVLEALTRISHLVASSDDRATFFEKMSETVAQLLGARRAAFWLVTGDRLTAQPSQGFSNEQLAGMRLDTTARSELAIERPLHQGLALRFTTEDLPLGDPARRVFESIGVGNGLAVPWRTAREPIGVLMAYDASDGWSAQSEWMLRLSARSSALVWQGYQAEQRMVEVRAEEMDRLAEYAARIAALDEQKSEFLRLASHELRTPMTVVRGYLSMLEEGALGELPPEAAGVIPVMSSRTTQMGTLVEQMLAASRTEDAAFVPEIERVDLEQLVRRVVGHLDGTALGRHIAIEASGDVHALADAGKTETIVSNLLTNAIKYSPDGDELAVRLAHEGGAVTVGVADRGVGISAQDQARLFEPFRRVESEVTRGIPGTGLGLYLSRRLARLQGGDITVESAPGEGSTFTLQLPAAPAP